MPFQPERVGPRLLAVVYQLLQEAGLDPGHIEICYDGFEDGGTYALAHHLHPTGHDHGHALNLATALRAVAPGSAHPEANGLFIRYFPDGSLVVNPAVIGLRGEDEEDDDDEA